jgi:hypothetical protein
MERYTTSLTASHQPQASALCASDPHRGLAHARVVQTTPLPPHQRRNRLAPLAIDRAGVPGRNGAVPESNLQTVRRGYELLNRGQVDGFLTEFVHPEYEFHTGVQVPSIPTVVRGRDALPAWIQQWYQEPWEGSFRRNWRG